MNSITNIPLTILFLLAALSVISWIAQHKIQLANSKLESDRKELVEFVYGEKRKKFLNYNILLFILFLVAIKFFHQFFISIGIIFMILIGSVRHVFIKRIKKDFSDMNFPITYITQIISANMILYFASFLMGIVAALFTAYYHYH